MADTAKHTPGPWAVSEKKANGTKAYVDGSAGYIVAQAYCSPSASTKYNELWAEAECNAQLIAAAPELLAALKDSAIMVARLKKQLRIVDNAGYTHDGRMLSLTCVEDATSAAIAKAEGRA
jgi:hypothetical protein